VLRIATWVAASRCAVRSLTRLLWLHRFGSASRAVPPAGISWPTTIAGARKALSSTGALVRLRSSAESSYWHGRVSRAYVASTVWNLRRKRIWTAANRAGAGLPSLVGMCFRRVLERSKDENPLRAVLPAVVDLPVSRPLLEATGGDLAKSPRCVSDVPVGDRRVSQPNDRAAGQVDRRRMRIRPAGARCASRGQRLFCPQMNCSASRC